MPCRVDICPKCNQYDCGGFIGPCKYEGKSPPKTEPLRVNEIKAKGFDIEGALCDVLNLIEGWRDAELLAHVDPATLKWWKKHETSEQDRIKKEALAKLTPRERRALGLK